MASSSSLLPTLRRLAPRLAASSLRTLPAAAAATIRAPAPLRAAHTGTAPSHPSVTPSRGAASSAAAAAAEPETMFCYHCEQHDAGMCGTDAGGVCGKTPPVANLQDLTIQALKAISQYMRVANALASEGKADDAVRKTLGDANSFYLDAAFSTLTNVNFDQARFGETVDRAAAVMADLKAAIDAMGGDSAAGSAAARFGDVVGAGESEMSRTAYKSVGVKARLERVGNEDLNSVMELTTYGIKGLCAYMHHAVRLGKTDAGILEQMHDVVAKIADAEAACVAGEPVALGDLVGNALKLGELNVGVVKMLSDGHSEKFGVPEPNEVKWFQPGQVPRERPSVLISGHDLIDMEALLQQAESAGVDVYTHGEMLPAHGYPKLRAFSCLKGHYAGPWQLQKMEFGQFPGSILMTSNCIVEPRKKYRDRIFTKNSVGFPGVVHVPQDDLKVVLDRAVEFQQNENQRIPESQFDVGTVSTGYGHQWILSHAGTIVDMIKSGDIKHFFVIGGCDGSEGSRSYFHDLAVKTPENSVILTMGCGKYRFNHLKLDPIQGKIPRVMDLGQCNDTYSGVVVASALAEAFKCGINDLPLSFAISWFEQKAVVLLLSCLHLGIKNIHLGPNLPAFVTPNVLAFLVENYGIRPTDPTKVDEDLKGMLGGK